jgi:AbrB family looped-hinge helix DNA binding protein
VQPISAKVSAKYQIVIPKAVRETLDLHPQDTVLFLIEGDAVYLRPKPASFTATLRGLHRHVWPDESDAWLDEERSAWT